MIWKVFKVILLVAASLLVYQSIVNGAFTP